MGELEVPDELWARIAPLLPRRTRRERWPGRKALDDRACLNGILFVLATGIRWDRLPLQLGYGSGVTCWRQLRDWTQVGVWDRLHELLLAELHAADQLDWSRAAVDSSHVRSPGAAAIGPSPVDRARPGSKHHVLTDSHGIPLAVTVTGGNRNDITQLIPLLDAIHPCVASPADHDASPPACWPTAATTTTSTADSSAPADLAGHRPPRGRARLRSRRVPVGRRAHHRLAPPVLTPPRALGVPRRSSSWAAQARLLPHLLAPPEPPILK